MLESVLTKQKKSLEYFYANIDHSAIEQLIEVLIKCSGRIHISGVGKSGFIAEKIAATLTSFGIPSHFLHPTNALHGDLGAVHNDDCVLLLSKSGETQELIELKSYLEVPTVAITCSADSTLAKHADQHVELPLLEELCVYDLAPTTSAALQLLFGDIVAVELMKRKEITRSEYHRNHPSGIIGKKAKLVVSELMLKKDAIPKAEKSTTMREIIMLMSQKSVGCVLVMENEQVRGILTDGDLKRILCKSENPLNDPVEKYMTASFLEVTAEMNVWDAVKTMQKDRTVHQAPVTKGGLLLGLLRMQDILKEGIR